MARIGIHRSSPERGFTLIELLIVVGILAILVAIAIPFYTNYRLNSFNATALSDMRSGKTALEGYAADNSSYP